MTHYLALDPSTKQIGAALGRPDMDTPSASIFRPPVVGARHGVMLGAIRDWLDTAIKVHHVRKVCFEAPFLGKNAYAFGLVSKVIGVIELVCDDHEIPCVEVSPSEWRMRFIHTSQAPRTVPKHKRRAWLKTAAMTACGDRGWLVENDDEAEACGILDFALACDFKDYGTSAGAPLLAGGAA